ncbi:hypothetical protein I633_22681 (plasmid) [Alteromonas mediterranea 615]|uniref:Uncharacterized protein n=1 Tax=Alteromonas mediterranea 615 TaxID=1300253 RepID=S5ALT1_9ALTE|nr:hypothetical protein I633_22681 [Alteromonas mediterranea 615]|tara:strand:+ start:5241 stop:5390 length:150 start_codon:yes stop_codon:yes gene_type:complete
MNTFNIPMTETEAQLLLRLLSGQDLNAQEKRELFDVENYLQDSLKELQK